MDERQSKIGYGDILRHENGTFWKVVGAPEWQNEHQFWVVKVKVVEVKTVDASNFPAWERSLTRIEQGEKRDWKRRNQ